MATHKSAIKAHRQELKRRADNRQHRTKLRTQVKKIRQALESQDAGAAQSLLPGTLSLIDHTVKLGAIHRNSGARTKSRLARAVHKLTSA